MDIKFRVHSAVICLDDKHRVPIGEPGYPVAAVERGKRVMWQKTNSSWLLIMTLLDLA